MACAARPGNGEGPGFSPHSGEGEFSAFDIRKQVTTVCGLSDVPRPIAAGGERKSRGQRKPLAIAWRGSRCGGHDAAQLAGTSPPCPFSACGEEEPAHLLARSPPLTTKTNHETKDQAPFLPSTR